MKDPTPVLPMRGKSYADLICSLRPSRDGHSVFSGRMPRENWRKRVGVEPTKDRQAAPTGFEVRPPHRERFPSLRNLRASLDSEIPERRSRINEKRATGNVQLQVGGERGTSRKKPSNCNPFVTTNFRPAFYTAPDRFELMQASILEIYFAPSGVFKMRESPRPSSTP
jgi:hypothetical protein